MTGHPTVGIEVSWALVDGGFGFMLSVTVPEGCPAEVLLPDGTAYEGGARLQLRGATGCRVRMQPPAGLGRVIL